jgi:hypothetical protein
MASKTTTSPTTLTIPAKWGLTSFTIHYEGEDLSNDENPFAANVSVQLRTDVKPGFSTTDVVAADLQTLRATVRDLELAGKGELQVRKNKLQHLELTFRDATLGTMRQLFIYVDRGDRIYTVVGMHVDARFDQIRSDVIGAAASLLPEKN